MPIMINILNTGEIGLMIWIYLLSNITSGSLSIIFYIIIIYVKNNIFVINNTIMAT